MCLRETVYDCKFIGGLKMTIIEKKEYLKRYKRAKQRIEAITTELENIRLEALPGGIDYSRDKIQSSPSNSQMDDYIIKVETLINKLNKLKSDSVDICTEILNVISSIDDDTYQAVLHRRYILLQSWEEISESMHYSMQWVLLKHGEALAELQILE